MGEHHYKKVQSRVEVFTQVQHFNSLCKVVERAIYEIKIFITKLASPINLEFLKEEILKFEINLWT